MRTVLVKMELICDPVVTSDGQSMVLARLGSMKEEQAALVIGLEDIVNSAALCNCGFSRGKNRLTHDED